MMMATSAKMARLSPGCLAALAGLAIIAGGVSAAAAQEIAGGIDAVSERVLFVTSGGAWQASGESEAASTKASGDESTGAPASEEGTPEPAEAAAPQAERGFYRLVVIRSTDNTSRVYLQQIGLADDGPQLVATTEIDEINALNAYVTDVGREESAGQPGFSAFVFLKTDPALAEPDTWTIFVDEFGDLAVERATN